MRTILLSFVAALALSAQTQPPAGSAPFHFASRQVQSATGVDSQRLTLPRTATPAAVSYDGRNENGYFNTYSISISNHGTGQGHTTGSPTCLNCSTAQVTALKAAMTAVGLNPTAYDPATNTTGTLASNAAGIAAGSSPFLNVGNPVYIEHSGVTTGLVVEVQIATSCSTPASYVSCDAGQAPGAGGRSHLFSTNLLGTVWYDLTPAFNRTTGGVIHPYQSWDEQWLFFGARDLVGPNTYGTWHGDLALISWDINGIPNAIGSSVGSVYNGTVANPYNGSNTLIQPSPANYPNSTYFESDGMSPDGRWLGIYVNDNTLAPGGYSARLVRYDLVNGGYQQISDDPEAIKDYWEFWRPGPNVTLANGFNLKDSFIYMTSANGVEVDTSSFCDLYSMKIDGSGKRRLTYADDWGNAETISAKGITARGAWAASTAYVTGDVVSNAGSNYVATSSFTSGGSFDNTNFASFSPICHADPEWNYNGTQLWTYANLGLGPGYPGKMWSYNIEADPLVPRATATTGKVSVSRKWTRGKRFVSATQQPVPYASLGTSFAAAAAEIIGPLTAIGTSPWPYVDALEVNTANYFNAQLTNACNPTPLLGYSTVVTDGCAFDTWNVATPTATINTPATAGTTYTFAGLNTQSTFCGGGTTPSGLTQNFVVWYNAGANRMPIYVSTCPSSTTVTGPAWSHPLESGLSFSLTTNASNGNIQGQSSNIDYYDSVVAFYAAYFRTGNSTYLTAARNLADKWYTQPFFDKGQRAIDNVGTFLITPRKLAIAGLVLRALDGQPGYWRGIEASNATLYNYNCQAGSLGDVRECGYATYFVGLQAYLDPNSSGTYCGATTCALYARTLYDSDLTVTWAPARVASGMNAGVWQSITYGRAPWNGNTMPAVTLTNGSTSVVTGTDSAATIAAVTSIPATDNVWAWFTSTCTPTSNADGDATAYHITYVDATHFNLDRAYAGTTRTTSCWQFSGLVGFATQPYMLAMPYRAFQVGVTMGDANSAALITYMDAIVTYWQGVGYKATTLNTTYGTSARGLWYATGTPSYNANGHGHTDEDYGVYGQGNDAVATRQLTPEIMGAVARAYQRTGDATLHTFGENIFSAMYAGPDTGCLSGTLTGPVTGGALVDGYYIGGAIGVTKPVGGSGPVCGYDASIAWKWHGFQFGFDGVETWLAVR